MRVNKVKKGTKVRITDNPKLPDDTPDWIESMDEFKGKVAVITGRSEYDPVYWTIDIDNGEWVWAARWFEEV